MTSHLRKKHNANQFAHTKNSNPDNAKNANAPDVRGCLQSFCTRVGWQPHIRCCRSLKVAASMLVPRWGNAKTEEHKDYQSKWAGRTIANA